MKYSGFINTTNETIGNTTFLIEIHKTSDRTKQNMIPERRPKTVFKQF